MKPLGIRLRVLLAMMAVISGLLVLTYGVMDALVDRFLDAEITDSLRRGRTAYTSFTAVRDAVLLDQARSLAQAPHLRAVLGTPDVDATTVRYTVSSLADVVSGTVLFIADANGRILADTREGDIDAELEGRSPSIAQALRGNEFCGVSDFAGEPCLVAICPVTLDRTVLGLLGLAYPLDRHVRDLQNVTGLDVTILRGERVLVSTWTTGDRETPWSDPSVLEVARGSPAQAESSRVKLGSREYMLTSIALEPESTRLLLSRPLDQVLSHFQRAKGELLLIGAGIAALGLLVSQWISKRIGDPIRELTHAANVLAGGDLSAEVRVASEDEIGVLGRSFNAMARQLASSMHEIERKADAAERANRAKSVFLATMSHELRTPLNAILGFNAQLLDSRLDAEQRDSAQTVKSSGEELLGMIEGVLDFANVEGGSLRIESDEFDLRGCVQGAVDNLRASIDGKPIALGIEIEGGVPSKVRGSEKRVRQALGCYLQNAAKFTAAGQVTVRAAVVARNDSGVTVRLEVRDSGIGIASADIERLFKPFSQLDEGSNREYGGTGLGLAICKRLAELMHGEVGVQSERGVGSTFWFTARFESVAPSAIDGAKPSEPSKRASATEIAPPAPMPSARTAQRILVAEDNAVNRKIVGVVLKKAGWQYAFAENGRQAVELALAERFDLVLMDCQMPVMDGFEATRQLRTSDGRTSREVAIVALTANAMAGDREACLAAGMDDFVAKPFQAPDLIASIARNIERSSARHAAA